MTKHERKIKRISNPPRMIFLSISNKIEDWVFWGYMPSGEPIWYNEIDCYTYIGHMN